MISAPSDRSCRWFKYKKDVHRKVLRFFDVVLTKRRSSSSHQQAVDHFAYVVTIWRLWLFRLGVSGELPLELFLQRVPLESLASQTDEMHAARLVNLMLSGRNGADSSVRPFQYRRLTLSQLRRRHPHTALWSFLVPLWQIASLVKSVVGNPAVTNIAFWCREAIPVQEESKL